MAVHGRRRAGKTARQGCQPDRRPGQEQPQQEQEPRAKDAHSGEHRASGGKENQRRDESRQVQAAQRLQGLKSPHAGGFFGEVADGLPIDGVFRGGPEEEFQFPVEFAGLQKVRRGILVPLGGESRAALRIRVIAGGP
ncbi:hypothetical protein D3C72_1802290 [compost metagenome]